MRYQEIWGLIIVAVIIVGAAFYAGTTYRSGMPGPAVGTTATSTIPAPSAPAQPIFGTVMAASASSITIQSQDGATQTFSIGAQTQVSEGVTVKSVDDVTVGMTVMVAPTPGSADIAQYIQILPPPPAQ